MEPRVGASPGIRVVPLPGNHRHGAGSPARGPVARHRARPGGGPALPGGVPLSGRPELVAAGPAGAWPTACWLLPSGGDREPDASGYVPRTAGRRGGKRAGLLPGLTHVTNTHQTRMAGRVGGDRAAHRLRRGEADPSVDRLDWARAGL